MRPNIPIPRSGQVRGVGVKHCVHTYATGHSHSGRVRGVGVKHCVSHDAIRHSHSGRVRGVSVKHCVHTYAIRHSPHSCRVNSVGVKHCVHTYALTGIVHTVLHESVPPSPRPRVHLPGYTLQITHRITVQAGLLRHISHIVCMY